MPGPDSTTQDAENVQGVPPFGIVVGWHHRLPTSRHIWGGGGKGVLCNDSDFIEQPHTDYRLPHAFAQ